jgi:hypothetical protein
VKHYLYCSSGNTEGLDEYIGFFEIAEDGYCCRYLEISSVGAALRYTQESPSDEYGVLPEGPWDALQAAKPALGTLSGISRNLFDSAWHGVQCRNDRA